MPDPVKQRIAVIIRKHTDHGVPLSEVVDELAGDNAEIEQILTTTSRPHPRIKGAVEYIDADERISLVLKLIRGEA